MEKVYILNNRLLRAVEKNLPDSVRKAIRAGAELDFDSCCISPLVISAQASDTTVLEILLENGANPNFVPSLGYSPLSAAAEKFNVKAIEILLKHGANPDVEGGEALLRSAKCRNVQAVELLLKNGANSNSRGIFANSSPLHAVSGLNANNPAELSWIPGWGIRVAGVEKHFYGSKRHKAMKEGKDKIYEEYVAAGLRIAEMLIEAGADVNNNNGFGTPLHEAIDSGYIAMLILLLAKGANPNIEDEEGRSVLTILKENGQTALIAIAGIF